jgi:hypothetical protein
MPIVVNTPVLEKSKAAIGPVDIVIDRTKTPSGATLLLARTSGGQHLLSRLHGSLLNGRAMFTTRGRADDVALLAMSMGLIVGEESDAA